MFSIWVDADSCPKVIKNVLYRAANRTRTQIILVANHSLRIPPSHFITTRLVTAGFDMADKQIVMLMQTGDLVITADIPLANEVIQKGGTALNPRGELYTTNNIKQALSMRNFNEEVRGSGLASGGPPPLSNRETQAFANSLDKFLANLKNGLLQ